MTLYDKELYKKEDWEKIKELRKSKGIGFVRYLMKKLREGRRFESAYRIAEGFYG